MKNWFVGMSRRCNGKQRRHQGIGWSAAHTGILRALRCEQLEGRRLLTGTISWTGLGADSNWNTPGNWDLNRAPVNGDSLVFPAAAQQLSNNDDISGLSVQSVTFQGTFTTATGGYTLSGDDLTVGAGGIVDNGSINGVLSAIDNQINLNVALSAAQSWSINDNDNFHHLTVNGNVANGSFALTATGGGTIDIAGQIGGSGSLTADAGATGNFLTLELDHANAYTGGTHIVNGFVDLFADGALGPGGANDAGTIVSPNGQLEIHSIAYNTPEKLTLDGILGDDAGTSSFAGPITITGASSGTGNGLPIPADAQIDDFGSGTFTLNGPTLVNNGHAALLVNGGDLSLGGNSVVVIDNTISGPGGLLLVGAAAQLGAANSYQGPTFLFGVGEVDVGVDNAIPTTSDVTMQAAGSDNLIKLGGHTDTIGSLAGTQSGGGTNTFDLGTGGSLTTEGDNSSTTFAGNITGSGTVTKQGTGAFDLTGTNDYTGTTTVAAGTLIVDGSTAVGNAVTVDHSATLGGAGTVGGTITVLGGGTLDPGGGPDPSKDTGTLSNTGGVTFAGLNVPGPPVIPATFAVQLGGTAASPTNDQLNSAGTVSFSTTNLALSMLAGAGPFNPGQQFVIVQAGSPITTTFNNLPEGGVVKAGGQDFTVSYLNDKVTLTAVTPLVVTTANDDNDGGTLANPLGADGTLSLREAIELANLLGGPQTISFDIPGNGVHTIHVGSTGLGSLPTINVPVTIDGYTQPGASPNTLANGDNAVILIALDGATTDSNNNQLAGLRLSGGNSTIRGLVIGGFGSAQGGIINSSQNSQAILIAGPGGNTIAGDFIGTNAGGTAAAANFDGVQIVGSSNNTVGGTTPQDRNLISGNTGPGISIQVAADKTAASTNLIEGNFIGTDATGKAAFGSSGDGVDITGGSGNVVGGMAAGAGNVISGNGIGVTIENDVAATGLHAQNNVVQGNFIGTDVTGTAAVPNLHGVALVVLGTPGQADNNLVGGTTAAARNIISGNNGDGVEVAGDGDIVEGNYIGTDVTGTKPLTGPNGPVGNGDTGVLIDGGSNDTIGGTAPGAGNLISGNDTAGIAGSSAVVVEPFYSFNVTTSTSTVVNATGNVIEGNLIGTDVTGKKVLGNGGAGVFLHGVSDNQVGGTTSAAANVIAGSKAVGVAIASDTFGSSPQPLQGFDAKANVIEGNFIGTDTTGTLNLGNSDAGVAVASIAGTTANNTVGGTAAGAANTIAFNTKAGVAIGASASDITTTGNAVQGNSVFANGALGIDLGNDGVTQNTPGGPHTGPNDLQNFPVITSATVSGSNTTITGTLNSIPNETLTLEFFSNSAADPSDHGQGQTFLGRTTVPVDANGNATFTATVAAPPAGQAEFSATATDASGNTSEFSADFPPLTQGGPTATYLNGQTGDNTATTFVHNLYRETLGREPDAGGQTYWVNVYTQAATSGTAATAQQTVVAGLLGSSEYRQHLVAGIYHDFLHRAAEAGGLQFWTAKLAAGEDEKNLLAEIIGSDEYFAEAGDTAAGFVGALYHDLLGRSAETAGTAFWANLFTSPPPFFPPISSLRDFRTAVALAFLSAPEANQKLLNGNFPAAAGSVGAPGTPAVGADALDDITGNGWDNLYFQGNLNPVAVDTLFTQLQAGAAYDQTIGSMLEMTQYF